MATISFDTTVSPDGMLHLSVLGATPGCEVEVSVWPKLNVKADNGVPFRAHLNRRCRRIK